MPIKDIRSNLLPQMVFKAIINSDTTTTSGSILDTADYDDGVVFDFLCTVYGAGTYTPIINESDASDMSGSNVVAAANLIGTTAGAAISAATPAAGVLPSIGIFGTKRYIRVDIASVSSTTTTIVVLAHSVPEILPPASLSA